MNEDHSDDMDAEDRRLCSACIAEPYLKAEVTAANDQQPCFYCQKQGPTIAVRDLADRLEAVFSEFYVRTPSEAEGLDYYIQKETGEWYRDGEPVIDLIQDLAGVSEEAASDLQLVLDERTSDFDSSSTGEEQPFDSEAMYEEIAEIDHSFLSKQFREFERLLKEESRFFSPIAREILDSIFSGLDEHRTRDGNSVIVKAGPGLPISNFFRARVFQEKEKLRQATMFPDSQLGSPPRLTSSAGRMNALGVSVFYGADNPMTALSEVRPPVGSQTLVASFRLLRPVRLLDVDALQRLLVSGSLFDPSYASRLSHARFLGVLSERITRSVLPDHERFEYLATQAIADYLANEVQPPIDGILYRSVQHGNDAKNVVLFHKAARVASLELPPGTVVDATFGYSTDEGFEVDYEVAEMVSEVKKPVDEPDYRPMSPLPLMLDDEVVEPDPRPLTLRIDLDTVVVHHVEAVQFTTSAFSVTRRRHSKKDWKF